MKWITFLLLLASFLLANEKNVTKSKTLQKVEKNSTKEQNNTNSAKSLLEKNIQKQIEKEKKYKKEQKFYMGKNYNTKELEVKPQDLQNVPIIEPEYDFDMDDVY